METLDRFRGVVSRKFRTDGNQFIEIETNSLEFLLFLFFFLSFSTSPLRAKKIDEGEGLLSLPPSIPRRSIFSISSRNRASVKES